MESRKTVLALWCTLCFLGKVTSLTFDDVVDEVFHMVREVRNNSIEHLLHSKNEQGRSLLTGRMLEREYSNVLRAISINSDFIFKNEAAENISSVSSLCQNHTSLVSAALARSEIWALQMIDAFGKPETDFTRGFYKWYGSFDECRDVQANFYPSNQSEVEHPFDGKYCKTVFPLDQILQGYRANLEVGICVPSSCSNEDVNLGLRTLLSSVPTVKLSYAYCIEKEKKYDKSAIAAFVILGVISTLLLLGTGYDIIFVELRKVIHLRLSDPGSDPSSDLTYSENKPLLNKKEHDYNEPGTIGKALLAFSIYTNGKKILNTAQGKDSITCINGIRFLSITWVLLCHSYIFSTSSTRNGGLFTAQMLKRWTFQALSNGFVSVDSFFALSGLLLAYLTLKEMDKNNGRLNWFMFYFHRFWRLTPPYMLLLMINATLSRYFGDGPMYPEEGFEVNHCEDTWWWNLLYINNLKDGKTCFGWAWYLANDMQFFVLSPFMLIPLYFFDGAGIVVSLVFLLAVTITPGVLSSKYNLAPSTFGGVENLTPKASQDFGKWYYVKPFSRMGPYIIGILTGYLLYRTRGKIRINKYLNLVIWVIAFVLGITIVYGLHDALNGDPLTKEVSALYNATHRTVWGMCLCWVIYSCCTGHGGIIDTFLSWSVFTPLARLSYCVYLVHPIIMYTYYYSHREPFYLTDTVGIYMFLGNLVISNMAAFAASLAFEAPMMGLEKVVFRRGNTK